MTTSIPSGLGSSVGFSPEGTVGTATTASMRWIQHTKETLELKKIVAQSQTLRQGGLVDQSQRRALVAKEVVGGVTVDVTANKLGLLFKHALGLNFAITQVGGTAAWIQTHQLADTLTEGLTIQVGRPQSNGTVQQFTYSGCKILEFVLTCARGKLAQLQFTFDGWNEDTSTAYAAPTYVATNVLAFHQGAVLLGGSASTSSSIVSIAGGAAPVGVVSEFSLTGKRKLAVDRFNIGSQVKSEQLSNDYMDIKGTVDVEFANLSDVNAAFVADTATPLQFNLTGGIIAAANHEFLQVVIPAVKFENGAGPKVEGPGIIEQKIPFTVLDDGVNNPLQFQYQSSDVAI